MNAIGTCLNDYLSSFKGKKEETNIYSFCLMHENTKLAELCLSANGVCMGYKQLIDNNVNFLPIFKYRLLGNIPDANSIFPAIAGEDFGSRERKNTEKICFSFCNYAVSLSDHFWVNPISEFDFVFCNRQIHMVPTNWKAINAFLNPHISSDISDCVFFDDLCPVVINDISDPILSTPGNAGKRWVKIKNMFYLEKRCNNKKAQVDEANTFDFFKESGIVVPDYSLKNIKLYLASLGQYNEYTIENGLFLIKKGCLADFNTELIPFEFFKRTTIEESFSFAETYLKMSLMSYKTSIVEYINENNIADSDVDYSNFGFLKSRTSLRPAVWSTIENTSRVF